MGYLTVSLSPITTQKHLQNRPIVLLMLGGRPEKKSNWSHLIGRKTIKIPEIFSGVHGFTGKTVINVPATCKQTTAWFSHMA